MSYTRFALSLVLASVGALAACTAPSNGDAVAGETQALTECDSAGTWAIKVETPVKWNATFVLQGGTGSVVNWLKSTRTQAGTAVTDTAEICGVATPDYQATATFGGEKYGVRFPDALFGSLPTFEINGVVSSTEVGASFSMPNATAAVVGATLPAPATDPWPQVAALTAADHDSDGKPGVSADVANGAGYSNPPVNPTRTVRADRAYAAFRQVIATATGTVTSCERVDGTGDIAVINGKAAIDSHVVGCRRTDGTECSAAEYKLLDSASPVYVPTGPTVITMVKLDTSEGAPTCADVRATDFAPSK